jgi:hypothetical protein
MQTRSDRLVHRGTSSTYRFYIREWPLGGGRARRDVLLEARALGTNDL